VVQAKSGAKVRTVVEVRYGTDDEARVIPSGAAGVVRTEHADALGGYDVELTGRDGDSVHVALYANQFEVITPE
jgi:plasmid replication initiation protein